MKLCPRVISAALAAVLVIPATAAAQSADPLKFGIKAGVNSSTLDLKDASLPSVKSVWGGIGGVFIGQNTSANLGWQAEALFSQRGAREQGTSSDATIRTTFIDVPVALRFGSTTTSDVHFHACTGPQLGIRLTADLTDEAFEEPESLDNDIKKWDFGWTIGAGVEKGRASFDLRYTHGLTNIAAFPEDGELKNRTFSFLVGFRLK